MTGSMESIPYHELDRHHEQARIWLTDALRRGDARSYRKAERLEERCRMEKVRRARERQQADGVGRVEVRA